ncbi:Cytochrome P450 2D17 [Frankliniella fusca]|uniref:Cytochrome P450 2D17 n=1 Tax=Frankliniella fusca TaxID=407009 RepID=A0AAE1HHA2_9NEOP|nr:Cytochrome P450 2D17 [Frankliniella fusca]
MKHLKKVGRGDRLPERLLAALKGLSSCFLMCRSACWLNRETFSASEAAKRRSAACGTETGDTTRPAAPAQRLLLYCSRGLLLLLARHGPGALTISLLCLLS